MIKSGLFNLQKKLHTVFPQCELQSVGNVQTVEGMNNMLRQMLKQFKYLKKIHDNKRIQQNKKKNIFLNISQESVDHEDYGQFLKMKSQVRTQRAYDKQELRNLTQGFRSDVRMTNIEILEEEIEQAKNEEFQQKLNEKKYKNILEKKQQFEMEQEKKRIKKNKHN